MPLLVNHVVSLRHPDEISTATVEFLLDGKALRVQAGTTVAAALAYQPPGFSRLSVSGQARAPFCGMGICHECRLMVDGRRRLACQTLCSDGMRVETGAGYGAAP